MLRRVIERGLRSETLTRWGFTAAGITGVLAFVWPGSAAAWLALVAAGAVLPLVSPAAALALLAFTAPFEQAGEFFGFTVYSTEWLLLLSAPGLVWSLWKLPPARRFGSAWIFGLAFLAVVALSAGHAQAAHAWKGALRWLEFFWVLAWAAAGLRRGQDAEAVIWALFAAAAVSAGQGWWQTLSGPAVFPGLTTIQINGREVTRAAAGYGANTLALFLALLLPFAWAAAGSHPRLSVRRGAGWLAAWLLLGLLPTLSLVGAAALAAAGAVWSLRPGRRRARPGLWALAAGLAVVLGAGVSLLPQVQGFWDTKFASFSDRWDYLQVSWRLFATSPWLGVGPGLYRFLAPVLGPGVNPIGLVTHPHSLLLSIWAELGALGLAVFLAALVFAGRRLAVRARRLPPGWPTAGAWALIAGLAGFAAANGLEHGLIHDRGVHAALVLGAAWAWVRRPPRLRRPERRAVFERAWRQETFPVERAGVLNLLAERARARARLYDMLRAGLPGNAPARILELGCGPALDALNLAEQRSWQVCAVDRSQAVLARARELSGLAGRPLQLVAADVRDTGLPPESFDLVFSQGLFEHFPDPAPLWAEMARVLKPGGCAVVDVPQTFNPYTLAKFWHRLRGDWPWGWETQYTPGGLRREGRRAGFLPLALRGYGYRGGVLDVTAGVRRMIQPLAHDAWARWEFRTGSWWMMNLVMLFIKPVRRPERRP